jgi:hypothetical protein
MAERRLKRCNSRRPYGVWILGWFVMFRRRRCKQTDHRDFYFGKILPFLCRGTNINKTDSVVQYANAHVEIPSVHWITPTIQSHFTLDSNPVSHRLPKLVTNLFVSVLTFVFVSRTKVQIVTVFPFPGDPRCGISPCLACQLERFVLPNS